MDKLSIETLLPKEDKCPICGQIIKKEESAGLYLPEKINENTYKITEGDLYCDNCGFRNNRVFELKVSIKLVNRINCFTLKGKQTAFYKGKPILPEILRSIADLPSLYLIKPSGEVLDKDMCASPVNYRISFIEREIQGEKLKRIGGENLMKLKNEFVSFLEELGWVHKVSPDIKQKIEKEPNVNKQKGYTWVTLDEQFKKEYYALQGNNWTEIKL